MDDSRQNLDGKQTERGAIPKFASFKPNTPSEFLSQRTKASENIHWLPEDHADALDESTLHEQTPGQHHRRGHHQISLRGKIDRFVRSESSSQDPEACGSKPFVVDRVGDLDNLKFGALHRYATASYLRIGAGNVVGSPRNQKIDRASSTDRGLVLSDDTHVLPKSRGKTTRWRLDQVEARELKIKPREEHRPAIDPAADYVSLKPARRVKRMQEDSPVDCRSSSDEQDTNYRSLHGKAEPKQVPADEDLRYNNDTSFHRPLALDESVQRKRVRLSKRIDAEPANLEAWLNLISHQDSMFGLDQDSKGMSLTNAERHNNVEIKMSMYEKALDNVKDSQSREVLVLGMMQEATRIWETDKTSSCWKNILQQNPRNLRLWVNYLDFMQTTFTCFRFEEVQGAYLDCLNATHGARAYHCISLDEQARIFDIQIYVVLRLTLFMKESGFAEYATAAWQALLEYVFFKPVIIHASDHDRDISFDKSTVDMFEEFWDSEAPRIGEEGAEGWASFSQEQGKPPQMRTEAADDLNDSKNLWKSWLASERRHTLLSRNPARTIDDLEENDPYRVIIFSDVRPFLFDPPSVAGQQLILDAFIAFCCLPPFAADCADSRARVWGRDGFFRNDTLQLRSVLQDSWNFRFPEIHGGSKGQGSTGIEDSRLHAVTQDPFQLPVGDYQVSSDSLFAGKEWFSAFHTWQEQCSEDGGPVEVAWALRCLKSLISIEVGEEAIALYVLALELRTSPGTVRKTAKNILRKRPFSIGLYNAYFLIECRLGNIEKGEGVITTSINIGKKLDEVSQRDIILLWRTWIWETLSTRSSAQEALVRLLAIGDEEIQMPFPQDYQPERLGLANPALLLRTESALVAIRDRMLSLSSYNQATFATECLMLLAYLRDAQSLSAATSVFKSNIALVSIRVDPTSPYHEYLHQSFARLLYYHATHTHMFKPSDIRSLLADSIAQFPHNTIFLSLYAWNEARFRIDDRLRSVMKELFLSGRGNQVQLSVIPHFFAIHSELHRAVTFGSNVSTIRSTFERAVESDSGAYCAGLWKLYFLFEHSRHEAARAKAVFWRGLRACPWAKELYMLAFEYLSDEKAMDEAALRGVYELLGEKGLRVHVGLEDMLQR